MYSGILTVLSFCLRLVELTHLDLSFNPMTYLVEESVSMPKLTHLSLNHMALHDLSESALSLSPFISQVDLSYNQLPYIQALTGPSQLTSLNLTGNHQCSFVNVLSVFTLLPHKPLHLLSCLYVYL